MDYKIGAVVIGRNEGQRLINCLDSLIGKVDVIVYVDSGSTDNSIIEAQKRMIDVVSLDLKRPFTAARARNEGVNHLFLNHPDLSAIQFVDGDCDIQPNWVDKAQEFFEQNPQYAVVCGRRRERFPEQSVYNALCDIEWDTPVGDVNACGGDALIRVDAFKQVGGFRDELIAGEEPEMCFRLREQGWKVYRLDAEMTLHDAAMTKFTQWWSRAKRAGYAYTLSVGLHGRSTEKFRVKELKSIVAWGAVLPIFIGFFSMYHMSAILLLLLYPLQLVRLFIKFKTLNKPMAMRFYYAASTVLAKFPQFFGVVQCLLNKKRGKVARLIEYK